MICPPAPPLPVPQHAAPIPSAVSPRRHWNALASLFPTAQGSNTSSRHFVVAKSCTSILFLFMYSHPCSLGSYTTSKTLPFPPSFSCSRLASLISTPFREFGEQEPPAPILYLRGDRRFPFDQLSPAFFCGVFQRLSDIRFLTNHLWEVDSDVPRFAAAYLALNDRSPSGYRTILPSRGGVPVGDV